MVFVLLPLSYLLDVFLLFLLLYQPLPAVLAECRDLPGDQAVTVGNPVDAAAYRATEKSSL